MPLFGDRARALEQRLARLGVRDEDLEESFVHAGGKGGQNVNKVATCVVLVHRPTRIAVKCQRERTQGANRLIARQMLADKIDQHQANAWLLNTGWVGAGATTGGKVRRKHLKMYTGYKLTVPSVVH